MKVDITPSVGLLVRPGDVLVLALADRVTAGQAGQIRAQVLALMPDLHGVLVVDQAAGVAAYRPSPESSTAEP